MDPTPDPGVTGTATFVVQHAHTTNVFGPQHAPPGLHAATDADPTDALPVLGTAHVLSRFEFVGRESVRGRIPDGTGVVGESAEVEHDRPAPVGTAVRVHTRLAAVEGRSLRFEGVVRHADSEERIAGGPFSLHVVDRDRFRATVAATDRDE